MERLSFWVETLDLLRHSRITMGPGPVCRNYKCLKGMEINKIKVLDMVRDFPLYNKKKGTTKCRSFFGGSWWIRTTEALSSRFTVCPHWPLGNTPLFCLAGRLVLPDDLFILPQALRFVNSFFEIFQGRPMRCPVLSGCLCPCGAAGCAGLLAYSSTRREICQQPILLLL